MREREIEREVGTKEMTRRENETCRRGRESESGGGEKVGGDSSLHITTRPGNTRGRSEHSKKLDTLRGSMHGNSHTVEEDQGKGEKEREMRKAEGEKERERERGRNDKDKCCRWPE
jgi:hypothetical protein